MPEHFHGRRLPRGSRPESASSTENTRQTSRLQGTQPGPCSPDAASGRLSACVRQPTRRSGAHPVLGPYGLRCLRQTSRARPVSLRAGDGGRGDAHRGGGDGARLDAGGHRPHRSETAQAMATRGRYSHRREGTWWIGLVEPADDDCSSRGLITSPPLTGKSLGDLSDVRRKLGAMGAEGRVAELIDLVIGLLGDVRDTNTSLSVRLQNALRTLVCLRRPPSRRRPHLPTRPGFALSSGRRHRATGARSRPPEWRQARPRTDEGLARDHAWADRVRLIEARYTGVWELPVLGAVSAPTAVLIQPDGHVASAGGGTEQGLRDALTTWFGPPAVP